MQAPRSGGATYRHLLSPSSFTPTNPLRVIALCDIDAAYAQFEQVRLGLSPDIPLICAQWQSLIAVNYPARKFGIKRFHTIDDAKKMCPDLYVQHVATYKDGEPEADYWDNPDPRTHKVSLDVYRRESQKILAVFNSIVTRGEIEKASIDEAFLDLTLMVFDRLIALHPHLANVPDGCTLDSPLPTPPPIDWSKAGNVIPATSSTTPTGTDANAKSSDATARTPADGDEEEGQDTWEDWALCLGAEIMGELRAAVFDKLKYTCSAGIAHGKAMAKLCAGYKKPNQQTVLRNTAIAGFLRDMDFTEIRMLGGKLGTAIAEQFQVKTVGDLLTISLEELQGRFGEEAVWVYNVIRGIDHSEVTPRLATKSMLASKNTRPPVTTPEQGIHWIGILAGELFVRLREAREIAPGLWPKSIVLGHRTGIETSRHRQAPFPYTKNLNTAYISKYAEKLWAEVCQPMSRGGMKLNNMSLSFSGLERMEEGQKGIEGFFSAKSETPVASTSRVKIEPSPAPSLSMETAKKPQPRLPTLHTKKRSPLDGFLTKRGESSTSTTADVSRIASSSSEVIDLVEDEPEDASVPVVEEGGWRCPTCGIVLLREGDGDQRSGSLEAQKLEHQDYHFALSLQDGPSPKRAKTSAKGQNEGTKGKVKKKEGIQAFFAPKPSAKR